MVHGIAINTAAIIAFLCRMHNTYGPLEIHRAKRVNDVGHLKISIADFVSLLLFRLIKKLCDANQKYLLLLLSPRTFRSKILRPDLYGRRRHQSFGFIVEQ